MNVTQLLDTLSAQAHQRTTMFVEVTSYIDSINCLMILIFDGCLFLGDNGGPIYVNNTLTGRLTQVGVYTFSPDARKNAKCLDGHKAAYTQIGPYFGWIKSKVDA